MAAFRRLTIGLILCLAGTAAAHAQTPPPPQNPPPAQNPPPPTPSPAQEVTYKETVVVSASKTEQQLVDAPATMTVIGPRALSVAPSSNYADLLRNVPGVNITQISARDVNVTSRGATSSLATSQLAVVDGRSIYQDFFGFTMWDFMPVEPRRDQAHRGDPRSGVGRLGRQRAERRHQRHHQVAARECPGRRSRSAAAPSIAMSATFSASSGSLFYVRGTHAQVVNDRWAYKFSAGTFDSDAFARPAGLIPNDTGTSYPAFVNQGTTQPKFDARVDYDFPDGERKLQFSGGFAGTDGIMHTGIGPFDVRSGIGDELLEGELHAKSVQAAGVHEHARRRGGQPREHQSDRRADRPRLRYQDLRRRARRHAAGRQPPRADLRRQPAVQPVRPDDCARRKLPQRRRRLRPGRDSAARTVPPGRRRPASTSSARSRRRCFRRASPRSSSRSRTSRCASPTTARFARRRWSTTAST